jgi:hypothetical protein
MVTHKAVVIIVDFIGRIYGVSFFRLDVPFVDLGKRYYLGPVVWRQDLLPTCLLRLRKLCTLLTHFLAGNILLLSSTG